MARKYKLERLALPSSFPFFLPTINASTHHAQPRIHPLSSTSFQHLYDFHVNNFQHPKCLPKPQQRRSPPPRHLPPRPPLRRRRLERRPRRLATRRSAPRPARRPTLPTSTKVRSQLIQVASFSQHLARPQHPNTSSNALHLRPPTPCRVFHSKHFANFSIVVLKQVHPDTGISNRAMSILNSFVNGMDSPVALCFQLQITNATFRHLRACRNRGIQARRLQ